MLRSAWQLAAASAASAGAASVAHLSSGPAQTHLPVATAVAAEPAAVAEPVSTAQLSRELDRELKARVDHWLQKGDDALAEMVKKEVKSISVHLDDVVAKAVEQQVRSRSAPLGVTERNLI